MGNPELIAASHPASAPARPVYGGPPEALPLEVPARVAEDAGDPRAVSALDLLSVPSGIPEDTKGPAAEAAGPLGAFSARQIT